MSATRSRRSSASRAARSAAPAAGWLDVMHPFDRESYRATLDNVLEQRRGRIQVDFRLRDAEGQYHWFQLKARPVIGDDNEVVRIAGTLADVTEARQAQERILHDAVHDNLTGLPNRELFLDRVANALVLVAHRRGDAADADHHRHRPLQAGERDGRPERRRQRAARPCRAGSSA